MTTTRKPLTRRSLPSPPKAAHVTKKNVKRRLLTPEELAAEERFYRDKKRLEQAPQFHSHLANHLCRIPSSGKGAEPTCLVAFDEALCRRQSDPTSKREREMLQRVEQIAAQLQSSQEKLAQVRKATGEITLLSGASIQPVRLPSEPIGNYPPMVLSAPFVLEQDLIGKLQQFDRLICEALLLRKFGFIDAQDWAVFIAPITKSWLLLFALAATQPRLISSGSFFTTWPTSADIPTSSRAAQRKAKPRQTAQKKGA